jgi:hypothetical protein
MSHNFTCPWCIPGIDNCHHTDAEIAAELKPLPPVTPKVEEITPAPEKAEEWVPLGPDDVPPNSVFNLVPGDIGWRTPFMVCESGVVLLRDTDETGVTMSAIKWDELHKGGATISRDFGKTWEPCRKPAKPEPAPSGDDSIVPREVQSLVDAERAVWLLRNSPESLQSRSERRKRMIPEQRYARIMGRMEEDDDNVVTRNLRTARALACRDRTCGADDCPTCRPGSWRDAVLEDTEEETP